MMRESEIIAKDLLTEISAISRRYISILVFPLARLKKLSTAIAAVLVFIPPPVDAGDAPIHIKRMKIMMVERCMADISTELKPAVRVVVELKKATIIFPKNE